VRRDGRRERRNGLVRGRGLGGKDKKFKGAAITAFQKLRPYFMGTKLIPLEANGSESKLPRVFKKVKPIKEENVDYPLYQSK